MKWQAIFLSFNYLAVWNLVTFSLYTKYITPDITWLSDDQSTKSESSVQKLTVSNGRRSTITQCPNSVKHKYSKCIPFYILAYCLGQGPVRPQTFDLLVRFSADSSKIAPTQIKNSIIILFFIASRPRTSVELLVPQEWFTYQYLHNFTRKTIMVLLKWF